MSYDQFIYKSDINKNGMKNWDRDYSLPIADMTEIKLLFDKMFENLAWQSKDGGCWAEGCFTNHGFEISIPDGETNIITLRGCSQQQAIKVAKKLGISAFDPQTGEQLVG